LLSSRGAPSNACGLTGLKPTWGRVSCHGVFPLAPTLDHVGPMARSAEDCALLLQAIAGHDPSDPTSLLGPVPDYRAELGKGIDGLRIGIDRTLLESVDPDVAEVVAEASRTLAALGARLVPVRWPSTVAVLARFFKQLAAAAALVHAETFPAQREAYSPLLAALLDDAANIPASVLAEMAIESRRFAGRMASLFTEIDLLIMPVTPTPVPRLGAAPRPAQVEFTAPFNITGQPVLTLRGGACRAGLPIGFQLAGPHLSEPLLLRAGHAFQQCTHWHTLHPDLERLTAVAAV